MLFGRVPHSKGRNQKYRNRTAITVFEKSLKNLPLADRLVILHRKNSIFFEHEIEIEKKSWDDRRFRIHSKQSQDRVWVVAVRSVRGVILHQNRLAENVHPQLIRVQPRRE